jgi:hypothetical protein
MFSAFRNRKADLSERQKPVSPRLMILTTHLTIAQHCPEPTDPRDVE